MCVCVTVNELSCFGIFQRCFYRHRVFVFSVYFVCIKHHHRNHHRYHQIHLDKAESFHLFSNSVQRKCFPKVQFISWWSCFFSCGEFFVICFVMFVDNKLSFVIKFKHCSVYFIVSIAIKHGSSTFSVASSCLCLLMVVCN